MSAADFADLLREAWWIASGGKGRRISRVPSRSGGVDDAVGQQADDDFRRATENLQLWSIGRLGWRPGGSEIGIGDEQVNSDSRTRAAPNPWADR